MNELPDQQNRMIAIPEQTDCQCGQSYFPQSYLLADSPTCPNCAEELGLATCPCGSVLTASHRQPFHPVYISRFAEFECSECGNSVFAVIASRRYRGLVALITAILFGTVIAGMIWWSINTIGLAIIAGCICALVVAVQFYLRPFSSNFTGAGRP